MSSCWFNSLWICKLSSENHECYGSFCLHKLTMLNKKNKYRIWKKYMHYGAMNCMNYCNLFEEQCVQTEDLRNCHQFLQPQHPSVLFPWLQPTKIFYCLRISSFIFPKWITESFWYITHEPLRTLSENSLILSRTDQTSGTTFFPSLWITLSLGARRATWSTALFSVLFIWRQTQGNAKYSCQKLTNFNFTVNILKAFKWKANNCC